MTVRTKLRDRLARPLPPLGRHALAYAASAALQKGVGFVLFLWLAHALTVPQYASFGLLFALMTGLTALAGGGIVEATTSLLGSHASPESRRVLFGAANVLFAAFAALSALLVAATAPWLLPLTQAEPIDLAWVTLAGVVAAYFVLQSHLVRLDENHRSSLLLGLVPPLAGWACAIAALAIDRSVSAVFIGLGVGLCACVIPMRSTGSGALRVTETSVVLRLLVVRVGPYLTIAVLGWLAGYGNSYFVELLFASAEVARYAFAYTLASILQLVATSLNQAWGPRCLRNIRELPRDQAENLNRRFFAWQGVVIGGVGGLLLVALPAAIAAAGPSLSHFRGLELELFLLFAGYAMSIPWYHVQYYYFADDRGSELLRLTIASTALGMLAWLACMWMFGPVGAYLGSLLFMSLKTAATFTWARKQWALHLLWQGPAAALGLLAAGLLLSHLIGISA